MTFSRHTAQCVTYTVFIHDAQDGDVESNPGPERNQQLPKWTGRPQELADDLIEPVAIEPVAKGSRWRSNVLQQTASENFPLPLDHFWHWRVLVEFPGEREWFPGVLRAGFVDELLEALSAEAVPGACVPGISRSWKMRHHTKMEAKMELNINNEQSTLINES